jgi:hypothetical protein
VNSVFVLMRNEYPVKVFRTVEAADEACETRNSESLKEGKRGAGGYFVEEVEFEETDV